jgi:Uma2 family endonuclease
MNAPATVRLMTTEDLLALPEDGMDRWLIRGELREKPMTKRNRFHSRTTSVADQMLRNWRDQQPPPRGEVYVGEAGFILRRNPDVTVGIDVAYVNAEVVARQTDDTTLIEGVPLLAVEVLSPNDTVEEINEKVQEFLTAGVALVWIVDPYMRTVTVYRPDTAPQLFNVTQELTAEPHLPGLRIAVAKLFAD